MNCQNCNNQLHPDSDFCHVCGAKVIRNRLTFKNIFEHISETFFNYDNKLLRTFIQLFRKPEEVIEPYINGVRKRYVNPISYFGLALTISGIYTFIIIKYFPEAMDFSSFAEPEQAKFQQESLGFTQEYQSLVMMAFIPIYAIMARLTFIGLNKFNYTELLVIFMYVQAQMSIVTSLIVLIPALFGFTSIWMSFGTIFIMILYSAFCLKRLYGLSLLGIILRSLLFLVIFLVLYIIAIVIALVVMYFNGSLEEMIEAQKAAQETAYILKLYGLSPQKLNLI